MSGKDIKSGLSLALDNPIGAIALLNAEVQEQKESVEFRAGKIFLAGFFSGAIFISGAIILCQIIV